MKHDSQAPIGSPTSRHEPMLAKYLLGDYGTVEAFCHVKVRGISRHHAESLASRSGLARETEYPALPGQGVSPIFSVIGKL